MHITCNFTRGRSAAASLADVVSDLITSSLSLYRLVVQAHWVFLNSRHLVLFVSVPVVVLYHLPSAYYVALLLLLPGN